MDFVDIQEQLKQVERQGIVKAIKALRETDIQIYDTGHGWAQYLEFKLEEVLSGTDRDQH